MKRESSSKSHWCECREVALKYLTPSGWPHWPPSWTPSAGTPGGWAGLWLGCAQTSQSADRKASDLISNMTAENPRFRLNILTLALTLTTGYTLKSTSSTNRKVFSCEYVWAVPSAACYLSHTAQVVALEIVPLLCREVVSCPALVSVALVLLHDVLSWHGDRWQGEAGWWRHGGHVHRGHFGLEAQLVVWQLKGEAGLCP